MKLTRAEFKNFRLLRDLVIEFSTDRDKPLTVIRAANETGKTTMLNALQWALYGDNALPGGGEDVRLHPIDWDLATEGQRVPIMVTIEFEVTSVRRSATGLRETRRQYRLVRSCFEDIIGHSHRRSASSVRLFALNDTGSLPIDAPESFIADELPPELRDVFFTDGDRALSFLDADVSVSTKRERVQRAIRALLGLGVIKDAIKHVDKAAADINREAKRIGGSGELTSIAERLDKIESENNLYSEELRQVREAHANFDVEIAALDKRIAIALEKGDREQLQRSLESSRREITKIDASLESSVKDHANLFRGAAVARGLLSSALGIAYSKLEELYDRDEIPSTTIPVLEDRLRANVCICGETLSGSDPGGERRRRHIEHMVAASRQADDVQKTVTALYFGAKDLQPPADGNAGADFIAAYMKVVENRDRLSDLREEAGRKLKNIERQIDELPDTDVQALREARRRFDEQRGKARFREGQLETLLAGLGEERSGLVDRRDALLREQKKGARILAELNVTQDIVSVLKRAYERITSEELAKVSELMNTIFLQMIGADPEQGAIIRSAEVSSEFDIIVYGPNARTLNPDRDLNGASRRALTLAFILALTRVSEVEAPNVIDTPLGMMSGYVKRSVLRTAIAESSQLILFLTHSEIEGCEAIIDEAAGKVVTLTNPAHYPRMLANDPIVSERRVLACGCNHRQICSVCERIEDTAAIELA